MLREIFQTISSELLKDLQSKGLKIRKSQITSGPARSQTKNPNIRFELLRFGSDVARNNYLPTAPSTKSFYSFTFFIIVVDKDYEECLHLTELVSDHFEKKPFTQVKVNDTELEMALSVIEMPLDEINRFWMAQQQPHQPVIFFQARVSEI